jgi:hypothetical protein
MGELWRSTTGTSHRDWRKSLERLVLLSFWWHSRRMENEMRLCSAIGLFDSQRFQGAAEWRVIERIFDGSTVSLVASRVHKQGRSCNQMKSIVCVGEAWRTSELQTNLLNFRLRCACDRRTALEVQFLSLDLPQSQFH